jgi:hypothetical protein
MFTTTDDRVFFVAEKVAQKIHGLKLQCAAPSWWRPCGSVPKTSVLGTRVDDVALRRGGALAAWEASGVTASLRASRPLTLFPPPGFMFSPREEGGPPDERAGNFTRKGCRPSSASHAAV